MSVSLPDGRAISGVRGGVTGPPVVLEAGLGNPAATWVAVQRLLALTCHTIAYDRAGHGDSTPAQAPRTLLALADDLEAVLDATVADEPVVLAGHSWGGQVVRLVAQRSPHRVRGVMLIDPTVSAVIADGQVSGVQAMYEELERRVLGGERASLLNEQRARWARGMSAEELDVATADFLTEGNVRTARREAVDLESARPLLENLEASPCPVPIRYLAGSRDAHGDADRELLIAECERIAHLTPGGRSVVIDDARHSIPQESPRRTAQEIAAFAHEL
ncbi:alpha/beta fold hydrolase [Microbacterium hydrocarbonoxydans]|uniref:Pimeloyl-ACP methyl ester carboxylesterase n=1 Tax=Microbacterium hydrocarbonoxydans TaxID=273678 RepID=A0A1H4L6I2_9MICO|nr:alpha/beta hydrolase [Microbacterium hydrocarbonoxydans]SEB66313.1 Pimeloyl-ACP methyl ester carboxylesterase [Microbacterium hydrocarbonoxydans]